MVDSAVRETVIINAKAGKDSFAWQSYLKLERFRLENSGFELDERQGRRTMGHMVNPTDEIKNALGYNQMEIYVPIRIRGREQ